MDLSLNKHTRSYRHDVFLGNGPCRAPLGTPSGSAGWASDAGPGAAAGTALPVAVHRPSAGTRLTLFRDSSMADSKALSFSFFRKPWGRGETTQPGFR